MQLNLNLLTTLDALLEEGSVMGAADRLHVSQPATSRALGRLREVTGDQIFVRSGRTMIPTPYAVAIREQVHALVQAAAAVLSPQRGLDLATLDRTFTIRTHELFTGVIASGLLSVIHETAPGLRLRFVAESPVDTGELKRGRVDLELGGTVPTAAEISFEVLGSGRVGVALRRDHPLADGELTPERYAGAHHVVVSRRGRLHDQIDDALAVLGLTRRTIAAVPNSVDALQVAAQTSAITTIPIEASRLLIDDLGLTTRPLPLDVSPTLAVSSWHQRFDSDPAHVWLRSQLRRTFLRAYDLGDDISPGPRS